MLKVCSKCLCSKTLDCFANCKKASDGKQWSCKDCQKAYKQKNKDYIAQQQKKYREENLSEILSKNKIYKQNNIDKIKQKSKEYRLKNKQKISEKQKERRSNNLDKIRKIEKQSKLKHREKILLKNKEYRIKNKEKIIEYYQRPEVKNRQKINRLKNTEKIKAQKRYREKLKRSTDPSYKLITNQRTRISGILKKAKNTKTLYLLGCTAQFLKKYLEDKFLEGMTWDNYGKYGWHVDHIIPCSTFDLTDIKQQKICFHYTNLQPLWAIDNLKKGNKIEA